MPGMGELDAIAVGGGLAGSAFALELARKGARVAVLERTREARLKVCGDFLSVEAQSLLAYLGLDLPAMGAQPVTAMRLSSGRRLVKVPLPFTGAGLSRLRLDEALLDAAAAAGAEIVRGATVTALEPLPGQVIARTSGAMFRAKSAALATGKHNLRDWPRARAGTLTGFKIMLEPTAAAARELAGMVHLGGHAGGYAGACLVESGAMAVCWLVAQRGLEDTGASWQRQFEHFARENEAFGDLVAGARALSEKPAAVSGIPFGYRRREAIAENVFPLGDQLAVIPSFTGDGTSIALMSGILAARAVLAGNKASRFQTDFIGSIRMQFRWAAAVDAGFASAPARWLGIRLAGILPGIVARLGERTRLTIAEEFR
jgi:flavin-dependent dehydrogenase